MSKSAELKTEYGTVNQPQDFRTKRPEAMKRSFECIWERTKIKTPGTANRQTECTGCPQGSPKGFPCPYFTTKGGEFTYQSSFFIKKSNLRKERGRKMSFFTTAVTGLKTVVTAIGAGVGVWGVINLLEGYGNDNPGANAHVR